MRSICPSALFLLLACANFASAAPTEPLPTSEEIHQSFTDGKYQDVLHKLSRVMQAKEWKGQKYDRYDLLMVKAETHLRLKEAPAAGQALVQAAREGTDKKSVAIARATEMLLKKSVGFKFLRKPAPGADKKSADKNAPSPIDIIDPDQRKQALQAMYDDEKTVSEARFKAARESKSIPAILDLFPTITELRILEFAANGSDDQTKQAVQPLAEHAKTSLGQAVEKLSIRIDEISTSANAMTEYRVQGQNVWYKKGLQNQQPMELTNARQTCVKIIESTKALAEGLETAADYFADVTKDAKRVEAKAAKTQDANYSGTYYNNQGK